MLFLPVENSKTDTTMDHDERCARLSDFFGYAPPLALPSGGDENAEKRGTVEAEAEGAAFHSERIDGLIGRSADAVVPVPCLRRFTMGTDPAAAPSVGVEEVVVFFNPSGARIFRASHSRRNHVSG